MNKLGLLLICALAAALPVAQGAARLEPDPARLSIDVKMLSSDAFEGREPGTRAEKKTVLFIIDRMKEAGLQPGGALVAGRRAWTQDVPLAGATLSASARVRHEVVVSENVLGRLPGTTKPDETLI